MTYNPFAVIRDHPHWSMGFTRLPEGENGRWYESHAVMLFDRGLDRIARRVVAAHEVEHALAGDVPCGSVVLNARQEAIRDRDAARKLIEIHRLGEVAAQFPDDAHRIAEELDVDYQTLANRVKHLHPAERGYLKRRLAHLEETA